VKRRNATEDGLDPLTKGVVAVIDGHLDSPAELEGGSRPFAPVAARMARQQARRRTTRIVFAGASCLLVVSAVWLAPRLGERPHGALTYTLNGEPPPHGGYIAPSSGEPVLSFSDGTRVALEPTARARVVDLDRHGARIALDEGKAHVEVAHLPGAAWRFEAGPFAINVHGTKFSFGWNTRQGRLDVQMDSGVVSVSGPLSGGEIFLRAGQRLSVSLNDEGAAAVTPAVGETGTGAVSPPTAPPTSPTPAAAPPSPRDHAPSEPAARLTARFDSPEGWAAKLAAGQAAAVVADAERRGLAKVLDWSSSEDLAALADAARFEKNDALARRALLAQRRRFPRSIRAREASFLLGRLDDASGDGAESALGWYDQYLDEAPGGAYVSEALGRKMMDLERTQRHAEATAVAADYLRRFPSGIYFRAAQTLVRAR
jgi:TolA-binding protein